MKEGRGKRLRDERLKRNALENITLDNISGLYIYTDFRKHGSIKPNHQSKPKERDKLIKT